MKKKKKKTLAGLIWTLDLRHTTVPKKALKNAKMPYFGSAHYRGTGTRIRGVIIFINSFLAVKTWLIRVKLNRLLNLPATYSLMVLQQSRVTTEEGTMSARTKYGGNDSQSVRLQTACLAAYTHTSKTLPGVTWLVWWHHLLQSKKLRQQRTGRRLPAYDEPQKHNMLSRGHAAKAWHWP